MHCFSSRDRPDCALVAELGVERFRKLFLRPARLASSRPQLLSLPAARSSDPPPAPYVSDKAGIFTHLSTY
jgi:hypothetical protein